MSLPLISFVLVGGGVFLCALLRPRLGLLLPLLGHPLYLLRSSIGPLPTTGLEVILLAAFAGVIVSERQKLWSGLRKIYAGNRVLIILVVFFVLSATLSALISPHPETSWGIWKAMIVEPVVYAFVLYAFLASKSLEGEEKNKSPLLSISLTLLLSGWLSVGASLAAGAVTTDFGRLFGIYDVPNSLAMMVTPLVLLATILSFSSEHPFLRVLARASLPLFSIALLLTQSLAPLAAAALVLLFVFSSIPRGFHRWAGSIVVLLLALGLGLQFSTGKLSHLLDPVSSSLRARAQIWTVSWELIKDHPILGVGLGTFEPAYQAKTHMILAHCARALSPEPCPLNPVLEWVVRDPHNLLLSFWLNTGLLGLLSFSGIVVLVLRRVKESWQKLPTPFFFPLLTLLVIGFVDVPYWKNDLALLFWVYLFGIFIVPQKDQAGTPTVPARLRQEHPHLQ